MPSATSPTEHEAAAIFGRARCGHAATREEHGRFAAHMMLIFGRLDAEKGWTKQLHLGARRNNNTRRFHEMGADTGWDSIGDWPQGDAMGSYLDRLDQENALPKIVIYNLNPADNYVIATMIGNFQDGITAGKIQFGSGWWFLDQKEAMQWQMNALSNCGLISRFLGMLTDSRSFMSYTAPRIFPARLVRYVRAGHGERRATGQRRTGGASGAGHLLRECAPLPGIERSVAWED